MMRSMRFWAALAALFLVTACGPGGLRDVNPMMSLDREEIDFGEQAVLDDVIESVTVLNLGGVPLEFDSVRIEGDDAFRLLEPVDRVTREAKIGVVFRAGEKKAYEGVLILESNDPTRPLVEIPLSGEGTTTAEALIEPEALDFGRVGENRSAVRRVTITSKGTADLHVRTIAFKPGTSEAYGFIGSTRTPQTLRAPQEGEPDAFAEITVRFAPATGETETDGVLLLETSDPENTWVEIPLTASINRQPVAEVGGDRVVPVGDAVQFDGSGSHDPDGDDPITFQWRVIEKPVGSAVMLIGADTAQPWMETDLPGAYIVELVVTDDAGLSSRPAYVTISAVTAEELVVELVWNHPVADLDLHFVEGSAAMFGAKDCYGYNTRPDFGVQGDPSDDPSHSGDVLSGYGPETVIYEEPADGEYRIVVRYASAQGSSQTAVPATVRVYLFGVFHREMTRTLQQPGEIWNVGVLEWPTGRVRVTDGGSP